MKRDLFDELNEGFAALKNERDQKQTLKTHLIEKMPPIITPEEVQGLRERLCLSRSVFAKYLQVNERTLQNWEQGRATPNPQATVLIRLVERYPDTLERLSSI
jgi:putative transcriptional regulator